MLGEKSWKKCSTVGKDNKWLMIKWEGMWKKKKEVEGGGICERSLRDVSKPGVYK